ncbi:MAG: helix-turn-helix domain-containing protein [Flavisolibacter sp.]|nr:helix-turn-helix domain-containing protein [Flavisolibacter sp.]
MLNLSEQLGNVSQACTLFGYSRDSFYRFKEFYEQSGEAALQEVSRRKPNIKNRIEEHIEQAVIELATEQPALEQLRASNELKKKGIFISESGVRCVWLRNNLETFRKRLKALEEKSASEGLVLSESQLAAPLAQGTVLTTKQVFCYFCHSREGANGDTSTVVHLV